MGSCRWVCPCLVRWIHLDCDLFVVSPLTLRGSPRSSSVTALRPDSARFRADFTFCPVETGLAAWGRQDSNLRMSRFHFPICLRMTQTNQGNRSTGDFFRQRAWFGLTYVGGKCLAQLQSCGGRRAAARHPNGSGLAVQPERCRLDLQGGSRRARPWRPPSPIDGSRTRCCHHTMMKARAYGRWPW